MIFLRTSTWLIVLLMTGCQASQPDSPKQRFLALVRKEFKASRAEIESAFYGCFPKQIMLQHYEDVLATAKKSFDHETGNVRYTWKLKDDQEGDIASLQVETYGDPPYVVDAYLAVWWR